MNIGSFLTANSRHGFAVGPVFRKGDAVLWVAVMKYAFVIKLRAKRLEAVSVPPW